MPDNSEIGIFTTDINLRITSWNDWLEAATGVPEDTVKGMHITEVIPDIEKRGLLDRFHKVLTDGSIQLLTSVFHHYLIRIPLKEPAGNFIEMQQRVTISPLAEDENIHGTLVTIEDMTEQIVRESSQPTIAGLDEISSSDWSVRSDAAKALASAGKTIMSEVLRKIRYEHRNLNTLGSAMKVISHSSEDVTGYLKEFLTDEDHELRIYACQMLGDKNTPEVIEALMRALDDPDMNVRYHAIESLGRLKAFQAVEKLGKIAIEKDFFTSFPAIDALKAIGDNRASQLISNLIEDEMLGQPVLEALAEIGEADVVPRLVNLINKNSVLTMPAVRALSDIARRYQETLGEGFFIADLFRKQINTVGTTNLISCLDTTLNPVELKALVTVLGWIDDPGIHIKLTTYLGDPETRKQVIDAFVSSGKKVVDILISQLQGEEDVVKAAILALGRIGGESTTEALLPLLKDDKFAAICCGALAKIGDRKAFSSLLELLGNANASIRRAAIAALNSIGHPDMASHIPVLLADKNSHVRESALRIAGYFGFPQSKTFLQRLVADTDLNVRVAAIENLPFFEDERVISTLICLYNDENPQIRSAVVRGLGQVESKKGWTVLEKAMDDPNEWVRYYAIKSIDNQGYLDVIPKMKELALNDPVTFVRLAAIEYLGHTGGQLSVSILSSLTGDANRDVARTAVNSLGDIHHPDALPPLMALSKSSDQELRKTAIEAIGRRGGPDTAEMLQWTALTEKDAYIRDTAIKGLRSSATRESIIALLNLTSDPLTHEKAVSSLVCLPDHLLLVLKEGLSHQHPRVRTAVVEVLLRIHTPRSSEMMAECLSNRDANVRLAAVFALHKMGNRKHFRKLAELRETDPDPAIRKAVNDIIGTSSQEIL